MSDSSQQISDQVRRSLVENHPFFCLLNANDVHELVQLMQEEFKEPNTVIVNEGDQVDKIYFIAEGQAEVTRDTSTVEKKEAMHLSFLQKGDVIGLAQTGLFSTSGVRTAKVSAISSVILLSIELSRFYKLSNYPALREIGEKFLLMNFLKQTDKLGHFDTDQIRHLAKKVKKISIPGGEKIFSINDVADKCYFLLSGEINLINNSGSAVFLTQGTFFGETALKPNGLRTEAAIAKTDCDLFELSRDAIVSMKKNAQGTFLEKMKRIFIKR